jgi:hypothetical protein
MTRMLDDCDVRSMRVGSSSLIGPFRCQHDVTRPAG